MFNNQNKNPWQITKYINTDHNINILRSDINFYNIIYNNSIKQNWKDTSIKNDDKDIIYKHETNI